MPSDGASFSANSFIELNLSRPLLRACEALGYSKPTPIQVSLLSAIPFLIYSYPLVYMPFRFAEFYGFDDCSRRLYR